MSRSAAVPSSLWEALEAEQEHAVDAEAICEAAQSSGMRFLAVKTEEQEAAGLVLRTRDQLGTCYPRSRQRTISTPAGAAPLAAR